MIGAVLLRLDRTGRNLVPVLTTLLLVLAEMVPTRVPGLDAVRPALGLMAVHYWVIHRPDLMRPSAVFALALLQDLLAGTPLGFSALIYLVVQRILLNQRRFFIGSTFPMLWWGFALIALGAGAVQWLVASLLNGVPFALQPSAFQALLSIAVFPVVAWLLIWAHRFVPQP